MNTTNCLSIPTPCNANWNKMIPNEQGKFCGLCNHTVVDFTKMSDEEIKEYFRCHYHEKTCGRFQTSQLAKLKVKRRSIKAILLWCLAFTALMIGCRRPTHHKMGKVMVVPYPQEKSIEQVK